MSHRGPARFLAPLALIAACATIYLVAKPELERSSGGSGTPTASTASTSTTKSATAKRKKSGTKPKTYTVKSGDVLGSISESTGVAVDDLLAYNDLDDAQALRVGQKLKLAP